MTQAIDQHLESAEDTQQGRFLTFFIENETYGIEISYVIEIVAIQDITAVPEFPDYIRGLINLRGEIIPIMDVRLRFKKPFKEYDRHTCIIIIDAKDYSVGLIVDSVSEVLEIPEEGIVSTPEINKSGQKYLKSVAKTGSGIKLLLDCERLLSDEELEAFEALGNTK